MDVKTYRARTIHEALERVREDLGDAASILDTREVRAGAMWKLFPQMRRIEVTASRGAVVPSRLAGLRLSRVEHLDASVGDTVIGGEVQIEEDTAEADESSMQATTTPPPHLKIVNDDDSSAVRPARRTPAATESAVSPLNPAPDRTNNPAAKAPLHHPLIARLDQAWQASPPAPAALLPPPRQDWPQPLLRLFNDLLTEGAPEHAARQIVTQLADRSPEADHEDPMFLTARLAHLVEDGLLASGPLEVPADERRVIALVGPTGVGKTTTIAKLAAQFRLREKRRVGLVTVDTFRIAGVEQLRTYAEIIDLPLEIVTSLREMRGAVERLAECELIFIDTAGRSPADDLRIQELRSLLAEAQADETWLALSAVASPQALERAIAQFASVQPNGLILTKLDEGESFGNLLPLALQPRWPLRYVTDGQNVPDDLAVADPERICRLILGSAGRYR